MGRITTKRIIIGVAGIGALVLILGPRPQTADVLATETATKQQEEASSTEAPNVSSPREPNPTTTPSEESFFAEKAASPQMVSVMLAGESYSILIDSNYLDEARKELHGLVEELSEPLDLDEDLERLERVFKSNNPSNIITLRLALDFETAEQVGIALALYPALEAQRIALAKLEEQRQMASFFQNNRELAEYFFTLTLMSEDIELSPDQEAFMEQALEWGEKQFDKWEEPTQTRAWHENEELTAELNAVLSPAEREELQTYRDEKTHREIERRAYTRSLDIAERLGLNEADRGGLFEYLQDHPEATEEDIAEQLSPELRALLPES